MAEMKIKRMLGCGLGLLLIGQASLVAAAPMPERLVTVTGDAEILVVPDRAEIVIGVETWNADLEKARLENDKRIQTVIALLLKNNIAKDDIQTGYFTVQPTYENHYDKYNNPTKKVLTGYQVNKQMTLTVRDMAKFEQVFAVVQKEGANQIFGIEFKNSELRKYRDQARALAIRAAKEKAQALAQEIGQSIGKAATISESGYNPWSSRGMMQNVRQESASGDVGGGSTITPGKIAITAQISVSFELL